MTARANTSSGPKAVLERTGAHDESHPLAYAFVSGVATGLLLLLVGFLSDPLDTYFNAIGPASLAGGAIVAFFVWRRERQTSPVRPGVQSPLSGYQHVDASNRPLEPRHLVPFGPYGGGQWTGHPIGLVIVIGLLFMGLVSRTPVSAFIIFSLLGGAVVGMFLWLYHR